MEKIAVFPGSFDPVTRGHESILLRAVPLFDRIIVAVGDNPGKKSLFPADQRTAWLKEVFRNIPSISVETYQGLTTDFCKKSGAKYILRGLRTAADFDFERTIGLMNRSLNPDVETVFLLSNLEYAAVSSSIVREIHLNGGDISNFIPAAIRIG